MDHPQPALLRNGNRQARLGHRVHGGADNRDIQPDIARKLRLGIYVRRNNVRMCGQKQYVIKGQCLWHWKMNHVYL